LQGSNQKTFMYLPARRKSGKKKLDYSIIKCKYKQRGYVTVLHKAERDKSAVSVYNKQGVFLFTKILERNLRHLVGGVSLRQGGSDNCVDISGVSINTGLHLYTISGGM